MALPIGIGETISHYTILERLGAGGMGVVYKARDLRLDRLVALKFLPPDLVRDPEAKARFIHEARSSSALQHPNICVVFDIDETIEGHIFISMECLEGETLEHRLHAGPLPVEQAVDIASRVAEGLANAHQAGIIHRDLKPANIILTPAGAAAPGGIPKILDFGVARSAARSSTTRPGTIIGTAAYMSPEQARGDMVDHRTDIWSLGVVFYEMVTGRKPFDGEYDQAILYAVVHEPPQAVSALRSDVPPPLEQLIGRCLAKQPSARISSAQDLLRELHALTMGRPAATIAGSGAVAGRSATGPGSARPTRAEAARRVARSIAVLPFSDLSPDRGNAFFSEGLTDEIITKLSRLQDLRILSRTTVMGYDRSGKAIHQIARDLGAQYLLEGSIRKHNTALRITTQLIDPAQDAYLWAETYNGTTDDIFTMQENVATRVARALKITLTPDERRSLKRRATENTEAYQLYLKGRFFWNKRSEEALQTAIRHFQQAIEIDPRYALAWVGISDVYNLLGEFTATPRHDSARKAQAALRKALDLDDKLAEAHASLGMLLMLDEWDWHEAEKEFRLALRLDPSYATAHHWYAEWLSLQGRHEEALREIARAAELDPLSPAILKDHGMILYYARDYDGALTYARKTLEIDPGFAHAHRLLSLAYQAKSMLAEALNENQQWIEGSGKRPDALAATAYCHAMAGQRDEALRTLHEITEQELSIGNVCRGIALAHAALGEPDQAFTWLEQACEKRADAMVTIKVDPKVDPLRADPRFADLLRRVGFE